MSSSEDEEVFMAALMGSEEEERNGPKLWVHPICEKRETYGEFHHLFPDLLADNVKFFKYFRMSVEKFYELLESITPFIQKENTTFRRSVLPDERLACCLTFLITGENFSRIAFSYRLGDTTVREIVYEVCEAIWFVLQPRCMPQPNRELWEKIEDTYRRRWNFPNCIGALDGKHVQIEKPANSGAIFFNYKKNFSIVLLALVDAEYKFTCVDVGALGKNSDGGVFSNSLLNKKLQQQKLDIPPSKCPPYSNVSLPHVIVADEAFPLQTHIMRPYPGNEVANDSAKKTFNYRLSRARNTSEDAFGILAKRFGIYQRKLKIFPENVTTVVLATCVLHNYLREDSIAQMAELPDGPSLGLTDMRGIGGQSTNMAIEIRDHFKTYFSSAQGSVAWQERAVTAGTLNREM